MMSDNGTPLRVIQEVSGHRNLEQLQAYIEVRDEQVLVPLRGLVCFHPSLTPVYTVSRIGEKPTQELRYSALKSTLKNC
jgi:hypothetical protein